MTVSLIVCVACCLIAVVDVVMSQPNCSDCSPLTRRRHISCAIPSQKQYHCGADTPRVKHNAPGLARNLKVVPTVNPSNLHPSFQISWNPPNGPFIQYLTGFEINIIPMTPSGGNRTCRLLNLTVRLDPNEQNALFTYPPEGCFIPGLLSEETYTITVQSLPVSSLGGKVAQTTARTKKFEDVPYKWSTKILLLSYSPRDGGRVQVWFVPAPDKYDFINYNISLYPGGPKVVVTKPINFYIFKGLCPHNGSTHYSVRIKPSRRGAGGKMVCVNEFHLEQNDCMTTYKDFNITYGDPNICPRPPPTKPPPPTTTPFPMLEVIVGLGAALVLIVIAIILTVKRRKKNSNPQSDPLPVADDTYGSTGHTTQNSDQNQQTPPNIPQAFQNGNLPNVSAENPGFESGREHHRTTSKCHVMPGHPPRPRGSESQQSQRMDDRPHSPGDDQSQRFGRGFNSPKDVQGPYMLPGFRTDDVPVEDEGVFCQDCMSDLKTDLPSDGGENGDYPCSEESSFSPEIENELDDRTGEHYHPDVSWEDFS